MLTAVRRTVLSLALSGALAAGLLAANGVQAQEPDQPLFGLIGSMTAKPGQRAALAAAIAAGADSLPGCYSYVISADTTNPDLVWITEVWESKAAHDASLKLPQVQDAIAKARPLVAAVGSQTLVTPLAGGGPRWSKKP